MYGLWNYHRVDALPTLESRCGRPSTSRLWSLIDLTRISPRLKIVQSTTVGLVAEHYMYMKSVLLPRQYTVTHDQLIATAQVRLFPCNAGWQEIDVPNTHSFLIPIKRWYRFLSCLTSRRPSISLAHFHGLRNPTRRQRSLCLSAVASSSAYMSFIRVRWGELA